MKGPDKCPHCGSTDIGYLNYKHHLYGYCADSNLQYDRDKDDRTEYLKGIKEGTDPQFVYDKESDKVKCRCGHAAVFMRKKFLCGTITAYPCKWNRDRA